MDPNFATRVEGQVTVIEVRGDFDIRTAGQVRLEIADRVAQRQSDIVIDMSGVPFMDSSGLAVLVGGKKRAREAGGNLRVVLDNPDIMKVFRITGLDRAFSVYPTATAALADVEPPEPAA